MALLPSEVSGASRIHRRPRANVTTKTFGVARVIYLIIMFSVAAVGIASLWVQQKRERSHLESSERFLASLQKISPEVPPVRRAARKRPVARSAARHRSARRSPRRAPARAVAMDPRRREAARRRVEARRGAEQRPVRSRAAS